MTGRRKEILEAALDVFLRKGFASASIADIRAESGATTGSIYHFFAGKADIARALLMDAVKDWSTREDPGANPTPEGAIKAYVAGFLKWGIENPHLFRFVDELRGRAFSDPGFTELRKDFEDGLRAGEAAYLAWSRDGQVRTLRWTVAYSLMVGPSYAFLRSQPDTSGDEKAIAALVEAAWQSVRA